ncbi:hypothetical protein V5F23_20520 [Pseudomonas sp. WP18]|uniref:hypothetical protein n=1 Tax=Pseudomonas sp. WP18 TaxID=3118752 RepID=UPI0030D61705
MASPLSDLDELVLKCRDEKAKSYIREAVACYKSGAFRSSIVSTWIAVAFDIIDKYKELSLAGDKQAEGVIQAFEAARVANDISASLKFERELLTNARDKFQLISHVEFTDLDRLQQDRNRCAHPSMTVDSEIFNPPAELARVHMRSAVEYLLQYPPAQGKYALALLLKEVDSGYFPADTEKAVVAFRNGPLLKARSALVTSFIVVLLKKFFAGLTLKEELQVSTALKAIETMHKVVYDQTMAEKLSPVVRALDAGNLDNVLTLLTLLDDAWVMLDEDQQQRISAYVEELPTGNFDQLIPLLALEGLEASAKSRVMKANRSEINHSKTTLYNDVVGERVAELFAISPSFAMANEFGHTVIRFAKHFTKQQVLDLIRACGTNDQIKYSFVVGAVISALKDNKQVELGELNAALTEVGLKEYVDDPEQIDDLGSQSPDAA